MEFLRTYDPSALAASAAATHYASGPSGAPTTCYSFDSGGAHFVFLNLYYDGSSDTGPAPSSAAAGTVSPPLYAWLEADLKAAAARSPAYLFVFGHEPLYPLPDDATGRVRHRGDSLDAHPAETEAFAELLRDYGVTAYICGHTHDYSSALVDRILQVEAGRAAGLGEVGAPSSFLRVRLYDAFAEIEAYRSSDGTNYLLKDRVRIRPRP